MKGRFKNEDPPASIWLFIETTSSPPNDFVPHRLRQVLADPRGVQEVTEHHDVLRPLVLPLLTFLYVCLLVTDNRSLE